MQEVHSKNKFEKLVDLVDFIIKIYACCMVEYVDLQKYNFICSKQRPGL